MEVTRSFETSVDLKMTTWRYIPEDITLREYFHFTYTYREGRAIAEAVSHWLPTAAARVRASVWQVGFVVDKVESGQVFSEYLGFPCQNRSFHQLLHHHHSQPGQVQ
jgi:hypothetical protein